MKYTLIIKGDYYYVSFRTKNEKGGYTQHTKATGIKAVKGKKRLAEEKAAIIAAEYSDRPTFGKEKTLFVDYIADWLEFNKSRLQSSTYSGYIHIFKKHLQPYFGKNGLLLKDVRARHIEEYLKDKLESGLSPNTVIKQYALMRTVLQDAFKNRLVKENAADLATKPKREKPKNNYYKREELKELLRIVSGTKLETPVYLAIFYGLRRSEILGLKWESIDLNNRTITICNKVTRSTVGKTEDIESTTLKSESSNRTFVFSDEQSTAHYNYLYNLKKRHLLISKELEKPIEYVCVDEIGERLKTDYISGAFSKLLKKHGMRHITFHDLRHSCLTLLANSNGCTIKQVQAYAGHANYNITADRYSHVNENESNTELNIITAALNF